jgi:hypothetical protein
MTKKESYKQHKVLSSRSKQVQRCKLRRKQLYPDQVKEVEKVQKQKYRAQHPEYRAKEAERKRIKRYKANVEKVDRQNKEIVSTVRKFVFKRLIKA